MCRTGIYSKVEAVYRWPIKEVRWEISTAQISRGVRSLPQAVSGAFRLAIGNFADCQPTILSNVYGTSYATTANRDQRRAPTDR